METIDPSTCELVKFWTPQDYNGAWCSDKHGKVYEIFINTDGMPMLRPSDRSYHEDTGAGDIPFPSMDDVIEFANEEM